MYALARYQIVASVNKRVIRAGPPRGGEVHGCWEGGPCPVLSRSCSARSTAQERRQRVVLIKIMHGAVDYRHLKHIKPAQKKTWEWLPRICQTSSTRWCESLVNTAGLIRFKFLSIYHHSNYSIYVGPSIANPAVLALSSIKVSFDLF